VQVFRLDHPAIEAPPVLEASFTTTTLQVFAQRFGSSPSVLQLSRLLTELLLELLGLLESGLDFAIFLHELWRRHAPGVLLGHLVQRRGPLGDFRVLLGLRCEMIGDMLLQLQTALRKLRCHFSKLEFVLSLCLSLSGCFLTTLVDQLTGAVGCCLSVDEGLSICLVDLRHQRTPVVTT